MNFLYNLFLCVANSALFVLCARLAYGSWPWDWRKTWYATGPEIKYLRERSYPATTRLLRDPTPTEQPK